MTAGLGFHYAQRRYSEQAPRNHILWYTVTMTLSWIVSPHQPPKLVFAGSAVFGPGRQRFQLPGLWAIHSYEYHAELSLDNEPHPLRPGSFTLQQPGVGSAYHWPKPGRHYAAHFLSPMVANHTTWRLPAYFAPRQVKAEHRALMRQIVEAWPRNTAEATAALWQLLWRLVHAAGQPVESSRHPAVERAMQFIESRLPEPLTVADVAGQSGVSHNHLLRLFHQDHGMTIADYIRRRRIDKAQHLLVGSTLPVKAVAIECGIPDPQAFNKLIRRAFGVSPSALRAGAPAPRREVIQNHE